MKKKTGMSKGMDHQDKLVSLRRIEGQIRGIHKMIEDRRYCVDILYATGAAIGALRNVESKILKDHLNACVKTAFTGKSQNEKSRKIQEIYDLLERIKKQSPRITRRKPLAILQLSGKAPYHTTRESLRC